MIASLRSVHRILAPSAFVLAAVGLVVATRGAIAPQSESRQVDASGMELTASADGGFQIGKQAAKDGGLRYLWVLPSSPLDAPDLLVYAIDGAEVGAESTDLPKSARLLGPANPVEPSCNAVTEWPEAVALYSLGHAALVATLRIESGTETGEAR